MDICEQYVCRECGNVSWYEEVCHGEPMECTCFCGSGKVVEECHKEEYNEPTTDSQ